MSRVLVVDDSDVIGRLLCRLLENAGHEVVQVSSDAATLLNPSCPLWLGTDVFVCDLRMPDVRGVELLSVALVYFPNIKRVAFTGLAQRDSEVLEAEALGVRILHKPDDVLDIPAVVEELTR